MSRDAIGLDIGGANLKAATASGRAVTRPFELWRHPDRLAVELAALRETLPDVPTVAVTMTGELCDCFPTKRDGVRHILAAVGEAFVGLRPVVWTTAGLMTSAELARRDLLPAAAANWLALAEYAGRLVPRGPALLIDTGSTTTDIIPLQNAKPIPTGRTDPERLRSGELVYTGARRTPVCALVGEGVAAEWFATSHDVYVRLSLLPAEPENRTTADSRPMTPDFAHARLARMLGGDPEVTPEFETRALAERVFARQRELIRNGIARVTQSRPHAPRAVLPHAERAADSAVLVSGSGEFLARAAWADFAAEQGLTDVTVLSLSATLGPALSDAACAYALAVLAAEAGPCD